MSTPTTTDVLERLGVPVVVARADDTRVLVANPAARDLLGLAEDAVPQTVLRSVFLDPDPFDDCLLRLARAEPEATTDALVRHSDGTVLPVTVSVGGVYHSGEASVVVSFHDLSPLRRSERRLRMRAELEELLSEISIRFLSKTAEDIEDSLRDALKEVAQVTLAESAVVALWDGQRLASVESWRRDPEQSTAWSHWLAADPASLMEGMRDSGPEVVTSRFDGLPDEMPDSFSLLLVPIRSGHQLHGVLGLEATSPDRSWDRVLRTLETVARIFANVLQRRDAEIRARRNEELLSGISRNVSDAVYRAEMDAGVVYLNRAFARMFGYASETELLSRPGAEIYEDPEIRGDLRRELLEKGAIRNREVRFRRADGSVFWGLLSIVSVEDADGNPRWFDGAITDISDRKRAEEELLAERELLAITLSSIADGVLAVDEDGEIRLANERAGTLIGVSEHRLVGAPLVEHLVLLDPRDERPVDVQKAIAAGSRIRHREALLVDSSDERTWVEWSLSPTGGPDPRSRILVITDLTERRRTEAERLNANKLEAVGLLAGGIAHDFRNILSVIQGNASLARHLPADQLSELVDEIVIASHRAGDLTEQLLTFSRGGAPVKRRLDLAEAIEESVNLARRGSRASFVVEVAPDLDPVEADAGQIHQVFNNLLINALQAMPEGGEVRITARRATREEAADAGLQNRCAVVTVQDQGVGIPHDVLPRIFDPYFTTKGNGTGLGLATTYSIVKRHGGRILVESRPRVGSRFSVLLPAIVRPEARSETEASDPTASIRGTGRLLLVDDEDSVRRATTRMATVLGYRCTAAAEGETALGEYRRARDDGDPYDVVLVDLTIPGGLGGLETAARLRLLDPDVRVVVSSGYSNDPVMSEHRAHGFADVLPKPYTVEQLASVLARVLDDG